MLHDEKSVLDENLLEHHGIKGMKWGIRKHKTGGEIRTARRSVMKDRLALEDAKAAVRRGEAPKSAIADAKLAYLKNPDRATALRMTRGEMVVSTILLTPLTTLAIAAPTQLRSRLVESRLKDQSYDKMYNRHKDR